MFSFPHNIKGWVPDKDWPPPAYFRPDSTVAESMRAEVALKAGGMPYIGQASLRPGCSPVEDQGDLGSCTAQAGIGLIEYLEQAIHGERADLSRLFLYYVTRRLMHPGQTAPVGDTGASIHHTAAALALVGAPPEVFWPYVVTRFDESPPPIAHALARPFAGLQPTRLTDLDEIKAYLRAGFPVECGFAVFDSIERAGRWGIVPLPRRGNTCVGGHAILLVGYADKLGCLEFKNSWGQAWGDGGYGWLPYDYVTLGLADDFWTFLSVEFVKGVL